MKDQKGITLIALIITIIVMLILVAVTVVTVVESGLFGHAGNAAAEWENQQNIERNLDQGITTTINGTNVTGIDNIVSQYVNNN